MRFKRWKYLSCRAILHVSLLSFFISSANIFPTTAVAADKLSPCTHASLSPRTGATGAAAGTTYINLKIINTSRTKCSLTGIPQGQAGFLSYSQTPFVAVGPAASKMIYPARGGTVWLAPGATASVELAISNAANYPSKKCVAKTIYEVQITFNSGKSAVHLLYPLPKTEVCTKLANISIAGVVSGTRFP